MKKNIAKHLDLWIVFLIGALLRINYALTTPFDVRAYDARGHMQYVLRVLEHFSIPAWGGGWETHQPPLYYFIAAMWLRAVRLTGVQLAWNHLQLLSALLSIIALGTCGWIACLLFSDSKKTGGVLFLAILATLPGIVFTASRISNDSVLTFIAFAFTAALLVWWRRSNEMWWWTCVVLAAVAILTKFNGAFCATTLFVCLFMKKDMTRSQKWSLAATGASVIALMTGWLIVFRLSDGFMTRLLVPGNIGLTSRLAIPLGAKELLAFNPFRILYTTYNNTFGDEFGRAYFWEFLFKSAFFGEWPKYGPHEWFHRAMLADGLCVLTLAAVGIVRDVRRKAQWTVPLLATLGTGLLFLLMFRMLHSSASNQDFRFVPQIAIPIAAYAVFGLDALNARWKKYATVVLIVLPVSCTLFLFSLPFIH